MTRFVVATKAFNDMTFEEQEAVLDAQQYSQVVLTQKQIDREVDRWAKMRAAEAHFKALSDKMQLGVRV